MTTKTTSKSKESSTEASLRHSLRKITYNDAVILLETLRKLYYEPDTSLELKGIITKTLAKNVLYVLSENHLANYVSEDALKLWRDNDLTSKIKIGELKKLSVSKQRSKKKNFPVLKELILEHSNPLLELVNLIFDEKKDIRYILEHELITTWITKDENGNLNKKYKSSRPGGWEKCYEEYNIIVRD